MLGKISTQITKSNHFWGEVEDFWFSEAGNILTSIHHVRGVPSRKISEKLQVFWPIQHSISESEALSNWLQIQLEDGGSSSLSNLRWMLLLENFQVSFNVNIGS